MRNLNGGAIIQLALREDLGTGDSTSALLPDKKVAAFITTKSGGILAGLPLLTLIFRTIDRKIKVYPLCREGSRVLPGRRVARIAGSLRSILKAERTALNFLCVLSGIATITRSFVNAVNGTRAKIYDSRKTPPGLRHLAKYAVRVGGGFNHRMGLYDMVLIKDNHLSNMGIKESVELARKKYPRLPVEVEVESLRQLKEALTARPDIVMLDNMNILQMRKATQLAKRLKHRPQMEASGGVTLKSVRKIALAGVDRIAVGRLTHSFPILDLSLDIEPGR